MQGYVKIHRKMMQSPIWQDPYYFKIWMYCLMKASHKEHDQLVGNNIITLEKGQFITGRNSLADDLNKGMKPNQRLSNKTWYRYMENLEKWQMLTINKTNKYSVVSIVKWSEYQESDHQLSNKSPSVVHQLSTNKNGKNGKNEKKYSPKQVYDESSLYYQLANYFLGEIRKNNPDHKAPNMQTWSDDIRKMMELDNRNEEQIRYLMSWVQADDFEMANVLSPSKLRKRFDQLVIKVKSEKRPATVKSVELEKPKSQLRHEQEMRELGLYK